MSSDKANAVAAVLLLTALNFFNYIDRTILFAVQPLLRKEFSLNDKHVGFLASAFIVCYMVAAPVIIPLVDRYPRKWILAAGAFVWSLATLLSALAHNYDQLLLRHVIVGISEATFLAISPAFLSDLFPETIRGRVMGVFYLATPVGSALGYVVGGYFGHRYGWRAPFMVSALPGLMLAFGVLALREPVRGASDRLADTVARGTVRGLLGNKAYWTISIGWAMMTFAVGGMAVWMPTFLNRICRMQLESANLVFGGVTVVAGIIATLFGGWLGDRLLRRTPAAYQLISAIGMSLSIPAIIGVIYHCGTLIYPAIFLGEFFLLVNTAPLNAALVNSVSARIRPMALAVNIFVIHAMGDAFSPWLIGYISDRTNLQTGMTAMVPAVGLSAAVLFYGMRFAPRLDEKALLAGRRMPLNL